MMTLKNKLNDYLSKIPYMLLCAFFIILIIYRFKYKMPKMIFIDNFYINSYLLCFIFNILGLCFILYAAYKRRSLVILEETNNKRYKEELEIMSQKFGHNLLLYIKKILKRSNYETFKIITKYIQYFIPYFAIFMADLTQIYIKLPIKFLKTLEYLPRFILLISFLIDVYFGQFYYIYINVYLLTLTLISKLIRYSARMHNYILLELIENLVDFDNYQVKPNTEDIKNIAHAESLSVLMWDEINALINIENQLNWNDYFLFRLLFSILYTTIWFYILIVHPYPIFTHLMIFLYGWFPLNKYYLILISFYFISVIINKKK